MPHQLKRTRPTKLQMNLAKLMKNEDVKSGSDLARQLNISSPSINRILARQVTDPRMSTLILLADYFDVSIDQLLGREQLFENEN